MKPKRVSFTPHAPDDNGICAAQQTAGAADLTLNGADVSGGTASFAATGQTVNAAYQVGINSTGDLSLVNFTVTGTDVNDAALSEAVAGPNNSTVETSGYFKTVTGVAVDAAVGTNVIVGTVDEFVTRVIPLDLYTPSHSLAVDVSGTINYTVQKAYERPTASETPNWKDVVAGATDDVAETLTQAIGAVRIVGNSFTGGATVAMQVTPRRVA